MINLTGALRAEDTAELFSLHQWVGAGAPSPSPPLPQHPHPARRQCCSAPPRLWSNSKDSACFARDVSLPKARCLVLGPSLARHFPRFLPLLCFVCSQSVSFVSVFAKTIRSLPLTASPYPHHGHCILERSRRSGKQPQQDAPGAAASPRCCLCESIAPQGGRAEDGAFSCHPTCQLIFVGKTARSVGVGGAGMLGSPGGISSAVVEDGGAAVSRAVI